MRIWVMGIFCFFGGMGLFAQNQNKKTYGGLVIKTLVPNSIFRTSTIESIDSARASLSVRNKPSVGFGMNIRKNFDKNWAFEGGIFYIKRTLAFQVTTDANRFNNQYNIVSYEVPLHGLKYIPFNDNIYSSAGLGIGCNFFATEEYENGDSLMYTFSRRTSWFQPSVSMSYGVEFRGFETGMLYIGASYQLFFSTFYNSKTESSNMLFSTFRNYGTRPNYFSVDVKWFFE